MLWLNWARGVIQRRAPQCHVETIANPTIRMATIVRYPCSAPLGAWLSPEGAGMCHASFLMRDPETIETELMEISAIADDAVKFRAHSLPGALATRTKYPSLCIAHAIACAHDRYCSAAKALEGNPGDWRHMSVCRKIARACPMKRMRRWHIFQQSGRRSGNARSRLAPQVFSGLSSTGMRVMHRVPAHVSSGNAERRLIRRGWQSTRQ